MFWNWSAIGESCMNESLCNIYDTYLAPIPNKFNWIQLLRFDVIRQVDWTKAIVAIWTNTGFYVYRKKTEISRSQIQRTPSFYLHLCLRLSTSFQSNTCRPKEFLALPPVNFEDAKVKHSSYFSLSYAKPLYETTVILHTPTYCFL